MAEKSKRRDASNLEREFAFVLRAEKIDGYATEYEFDGIDCSRKWRFDFAWPREKVCVEVQGGLSHRGRRSHGSPEQFARDATKSAEAQVCGWTYIEVSPETIRNGEAIRLLREALRRSS